MQNNTINQNNNRLNNNRIVNQYGNREILSGRFTQEELRNVPGTLEAAEARLQGGSNSSVSETKTEMSESLSTAIKSGKWIKETVKEFENCIKERRNEEVDIERGVGERRDFSQERSEIHEGASIVIRAEARAGKERRGNPQEEYEVDAKEGREQERRLEA